MPARSRRGRSSRRRRFANAKRRARGREQLAGQAVATARLLGERAGEDRGVELPGEIGAGLARRSRLLVHVRPQERDVGRAREGRLPGQALVEDAAERVDVRALVDGVARDLLGGDVLERADELAGAGDARGRPCAWSDRSRRDSSARARGQAMRTFAGLTSRWTSPFSWAASSASASCRGLDGALRARVAVVRGGPSRGPSPRRSASRGRAARPRPPLRRSG